MTGCIISKDRATDKDGYPRVKHQGKGWRLHRLIYTFCYGNIPEKQVVAHKCNNKSCINPEHLYLCSPQQNSSDAARDGLYKSGSQNGNYNKNLELARKDHETILHMYCIQKLSQRAIAQVYGVHQGRISEILKERSKQL